MSIRNHFPETLTQDQELAVAKIDSFLNSKSNCFLLKGYAGTGKTFIMEGLTKYFGQELKRNYRIMAPTGRAAMIIGKKTKNDAYTIHKTIYNLSKLIDDEHTFKMHYQLNHNIDSTNTIYLIDESSMISDVYNDNEFFIFGSGYLLKDLFNYVNFAYRENVKIIFIGDNAQLPPVGMNYSPALSKKYIEEEYGLSTDQFELKEVVRQESNSGILETATRIRQSLEGKVFNRFEINSEYQDITLVEKEEFEQIYLSSVGNQVSDKHIVIGHSNNTVDTYNKLIRSRFFPGMKDVNSGDILLVTKNNYNYVCDIYNGQFLKVIAAQETTEKPKIIRFNKKGGKKAEVTLIFREVVVELHDEKQQSHQVKCRIIDNLLNSKEPRLSQDEQQALYVDFKNRHHGLKPGTDFFKKALRADPFFNALQVKYGYAVTCHKAQGGEWDNVFIDFNVYMKTLSAGFFRWAYTAITRTKSQLYSIGADTYTPFSEFIIQPVEIIRTNHPEQYYTPEKILDQDVPIDFNQVFLKAKYIELFEKLRLQDIDISITHLSWVERYSFKRNNQSCTIDLNYGKNGFTGRMSVISSTDNDFETFILKSISGPLIYKLHYNPEFHWQKELYEYMIEICIDLDIKISNIINNQYCDRYFIQTGSECTYIDWIYTGKGIYKSANPHSKLGIDDTKLNSLIQKLQLCQQ